MAWLRTVRTVSDYSGHKIYIYLFTPCVWRGGLLGIVMWQESEGGNSVRNVSNECRVVITRHLSEVRQLLWDLGWSHMWLVAVDS